jgi:hypothetical protein
MQRFERHEDYGQDRKNLVSHGVSYLITMIWGDPYPIRTIMGHTTQFYVAMMQQ